MRRIAIAAIMALVTLLIRPGSAAAWDRIPCDSGSLNADAAWTEKAAHDFVHIPGEIGCGVPALGPQFIIAVFKPGVTHGYYTSELMRAYPSPVGPGRFEVVGAPQAESALCLMTDYKNRLSCVLVSPDGIVTQLSTSDDRVGTADPRDETSGASPQCATCFTTRP